MAEELRKTGIEVLHNVPWGTHLCQFYRTKEDLIDILTPYFQAGLENNEFCIWVTSDPLSVIESKMALENTVKNLDEYIQKGQVDIVDYKDWYIKSGGFDRDRVLNDLMDNEKKALAKGFDGLRSAGNLSWLGSKEWRDFAVYEGKVDYAVNGHKIIACCSYPLGKLDVAEIIDVINNHRSFFFKWHDHWQLIEGIKYKQVKEALLKAEEEEHFHRSMDESPLGIRIVTPDGETVYANRAILDIYGYSSVDEMENTPKKDRYTGEGFIQHLLRKEKRKRGDYVPSNYEISIVRKDGKVRHLQVFRKEIRWHGNTNYQVLYQDITEKKQAEEELRSREEFLNNIIQQTPNAIWISDEKGTVIKMNRALRELFMVTDEEIIGKYNVLEDIQVIEQGYAPLVKSVFEEGKTAKFTIDYNTEKEKQLKLAHTRHRKLEIVISAIKNKEGKVTNAICQEKDITEQEEAKVALQESEQRYRTLFETTGAATILIDEDMTILMVNTEQERISGYSRYEIEGKRKWTEFVLEDDLEGMKKYHQLRRIDPQAAPREYECRIIDRWGNIKYMFVTVDMIPGTKKSLASFVEITKLKQAEGELRHSEKKLRVLFQSIIEGIVVTDMMGTIVDANEAAVRLGGYINKEELIGRDVFELASPKIRDSAREDSKKLISTEYYLQRESVCMRKDGTEFPGEVSMSLLKDSSGEPSGFIVVTRDVSERRRNEELVRRSYEAQNVINRILHLALKESSLEEFLRRALEIVLSVSWLSLESKGAIFLIEDNPNIIVMKAEVGLDQAIKERCAQVPVGKCVCGRAVSTKTAQYAGYDDKYHEVRHEQLTQHSHCCVPIIVGDTVLGVLNLRYGREHNKYLGDEEFLRALADVLANIISHRRMQKKVAEYAELTKLKSNILSTVSHELRTPLASIQGYSTLLLDYGKKLRREEKRQCLESIDKACIRLTELIDHLLDMSRLEAGIFRLAMEPSRIDKIIQDAVNEAQIRSPEYKFVADLDNNLPILMVDGRRIRQVFDNLLDNATKYSDKGSEVAIRAKLAINDLAISVCDQGKGIPPADIEKVFDPMYRLEERLGQDPSGLGLGLPLCKALVQAHGGRISLDSTLGKGTAVHFTLPLAEQGGKIATET